MESSNKLSFVDSSTLPQNNIEKDNSTINCLINHNIDGTDNASKGSKNIIINRIIFRSIVMSLLLAIVVIIYLICRLSSASINDSDNSEQDLLTHDTVFKIISRAEWGAQQPERQLDSLTLPVENVIFANTPHYSCITQEQCNWVVRSLQTVHMDFRNNDDIRYNFIIGGNGAIYEGRGWDKEGEHTKRYNSGSIGIILIGNFEKSLPPEIQLQAAKNLLEEGVRLNKLSPNYKIYGQVQLFGLDGPGSALYKLLQTWPHWTKDLPII